MAAAAKALAAARVDESNRWRRDGHRSAAHWMAAQTGTSVRGAAEAIDTAKRVTKLPHVDEAFRTGQLSTAQAAEVSSAAAVAPQSEHELLDAARTETLAGLRERCQRTRHAALPDETARSEAIRRSRYFRHRTTADGAFETSTRGLPVDGAALLAALEPFQQQVFTAARQAGTREPYEAYAYDALILLTQSRAAPTAPTDTPPDDEPTKDDKPRPPATPTSHPTPTRTPGETNDAAPAAPMPEPDATRSGTSGGTCGPVSTAVVPEPDATRSGTSGGTCGPAPVTTSAPAATLFGTPPEPSPDPARHTTSRTPADRSHHPPSGSTTNPHEPPDQPARHDIAATLSDDHSQPSGTAADPPEPPDPTPQPQAAIADGPRAMIHVRVDHTALRRGHTVDGEICEIPGIGPIPVATARMLAADSIINVLLVDGVDVTRIAHTGRTVTAHQRSALRERTSTCEVPGCDARHNLEIDHDDPWALSKNTSLDNLNVLCRWHHYQKTHCGHRLTGPPGHRQWHQPTNPN